MPLVRHRPLRRRGCLGKTEEMCSNRERYRFNGRRMKMGPDGNSERSISAPKARNTGAGGGDLLSGMLNRSKRASNRQHLLAVPHVDLRSATSTSSTQWIAATANKDDSNLVELSGYLVKFSGDSPLPNSWHVGIPNATRHETGSQLAVVNWSAWDGSPGI